MLASLVIIAGCISATSDSGFLDITITPNPVMAGEDLQISVSYLNKGPSLENFRIYLVDTGTLRGDCETRKKVLKTNDVATMLCTLRPTGIKGETSILIGMSYENTIVMPITNIEFITRDEYMRGTYEKSGAASSYFMTDGFVDISARFSDPMPFVSGDDVPIVITIKNIGSGIVGVRNFMIEDANNVVKTCYGMTRQGNVFVPKNEIVLRNGISDDITCILNYEPDEYLNIKEMKIKMRYSYLVTVPRRVVVE